MTWFLRIFVGLTLLTLFALSVSRPALASDFPRHAIRCDGRDMEYVVYVPLAAKDPLPVLMLLHGAGDEAESIRARVARC